jgi:hypothetical protein
VTLALSKYTCATFSNGSEYRHSESWDPTCQNDWALGGVFEREAVPREICMSTHVVPNARGPLRSEMMIIAGVIGARMRNVASRITKYFPSVYNLCLLHFGKC